LHAPALLREDGPGSLDYLCGLRRRESSELGDDVGGACWIRRWKGPLERLQNPGQRIVKLPYIDAIDSAEGRWQCGVIERAWKDDFSQGNGAVPFEFHKMRLDAPHNDAIGLESASELLYGTQVMTRIADEHAWHLEPSIPPGEIRKIVLPSYSGLQISV
jgi:hypothetical protein